MQSLWSARAAISIEPFDLAELSESADLGRGLLRRELCPVEPWSKLARTPTNEASGAAAGGFWGWDVVCRTCSKRWRRLVVSRDHRTRLGERHGDLPTFLSAALQDVGCVSCERACFGALGIDLRTWESVRRGGVATRQRSGDQQDSEGSQRSMSNWPDSSGGLSTRGHWLDNTYAAFNLGSRGGRNTVVRQSVGAG